MNRRRRSISPSRQLNLCAKVRLRRYYITERREVDTMVNEDTRQGAAWPGTIIEGPVSIGRNCRIGFTLLRNLGSEPLVIGDNVDLCHCTVLYDPNHTREWSFFDQRVHGAMTGIGAGASLRHCHILNSSIGARSSGTHSYIEYSVVGEENDLRRFSNLTLTVTGRRVSLGSEVSKSVLGDWFVSEHGASYLSLIAPCRWPIIDADGSYRELDGIPNVTNIGAGTVFANYGGGLPGHGPLLERRLEKGTAFVWGAFTAINSRIASRYGQPEPGEALIDLLRRRDITILGFASLVENKVTGRIPAFCYAGGEGMAARHHKLGWVLRHKPAMVATFVRNLLEAMGPDEVHTIERLLHGTIRLEVRLLEEALSDADGIYSPGQIEEGLAILRDNLDGRWCLGPNLDLPNL
ncbi:hypothetical protein JW905_18160 [bacterium]|nr:hypothetical protein [candidate division CSSED10-310 bacterium]